MDGIEPTNSAYVSPGPEIRARFTATDISKGVSDEGLPGGMPRLQRVAGSTLPLDVIADGVQPVSNPDDAGYDGGANKQQYGRQGNLDTTA